MACGQRRQCVFILQAALHRISHGHGRPVAGKDLGDLSKTVIAGVREQAAKVGCLFCDVGDLRLQSAWVEVCWPLREISTFLMPTAMRSNRSLSLLDMGSLVIVRSKEFLLS